MEDEQARQAAAVQPTPAPAPEPSTPKANVSAPAPETIPADPTDEEEDAMLKEALAMSKPDVPMEEDGEDDDDDDEEEAIQKAIAMSMQKEDKEDKS
jgi:26S proteasome regulatory subunit N10